MSGTTEFHYVMTLKWNAQRDIYFTSRAVMNSNTTEKDRFEFILGLTKTAALEANPELREILNQSAVVFYRCEPNGAR